MLLVLFLDDPIEGIWMVWMVASKHGSKKNGMERRLEEEVFLTRCGVAL